MIDAIASWTLTYLVHSTILLGLALAIGRHLRERPDVMSGVYKAALVGGVLTASVQAGLGTGTTIAVGQAPLLAEVQIDAPARAPVLRSIEVEPLAASAPTDAIAPVAAAAAPIVASRGAIAGAWWIGGVTLAALAFGLLSVVASWIALARRLRPHTAITEGPLVAMLVRLRRLGGVRRHVGLFVAARAPVPLATGILRPRIVLPPRAAAGLPQAQQTTMLAHELAHVHRHDPAWRMVALLVERGLFFQPLNRIVARRITECAEYLCDDWAARHTQQPIALASCLTEIAGWQGPARPPLAASAMAGTGSQLRGRVERLLTPPRRGGGAPLASIGIAAAILGVIAIAPAVGHGAGHEPVVLHVAPANPGNAAEAPAAVVIAGDGGLVVVREGDEAPVAARATRDRTDDRKARRKVAKANREAKRKLDKAMRKARKEGRAAPSGAEVDAILGQARRQAGQSERGRSRHRERHGAGEGSRSVVIQSGDATIRIEIDGDGRAHVRGADRAAAVEASRMRRDVEREVRRSLVEAERMRREAERMRDEAVRRHVEAYREMARGGRGAAPPSPPGHPEHPFPPAAPMPPSPPGRMKQPFPPAAPEAPRPPSRTRNPWSSRAPRAPLPPTPPMPPDVSVQ